MIPDTVQYTDLFRQYTCSSSAVQKYQKRFSGLFLNRFARKINVRTLPIETQNLRLLPFAPGDLLALIESREAFERQFGLTAEEGLHEFFVSDSVSPVWLAQLRAARQPDVWQHGFALLLRESNTVIGSAGFAGPPNDGTVEIAYGIVPGRQGNGYATEAAAALVTYAIEVGGVRRVRAHTAPTANASTRVLTKCGFAFVGEVDSPEDGTVWRWEKETVSE